MIPPVLPSSILTLKPNNLDPLPCNMLFFEAHNYVLENNSTITKIGRGFSYFSLFFIIYFLENLTMADNKDSETTTDSEFAKKVAAYIEPILKHLDTEDVIVEKDKITELFVKLWEYEDGEKLDAATQRLTILALFMYTTHNVLEDYNIRIDRARQYITHALQEWLKPEMEKAIADEKASTNPFKAFVDSNQNNFDDTFGWEHFMPDVKKNDETELNFKFKKCWFAEFFIRFGRVDHIPTACEFDKIPWNAREDYVDLKLTNLFAKLGTLCQFKYTPIKK